MAKSKTKQILEFNPPEFDRKGAGRPRAFKSPKELWRKFVEYHTWSRKNPLIAYEVVKSGIMAGKMFELPKMRAITWEGFECYCGVDLKNYRENKLENAGEFIPIITRIDHEIFIYNFNGAAAEMLNPNLIARKLGLVDKKEINGHTTTQAIIYVPDDGRAKPEDGKAA